MGNSLSSAVIIDPRYKNNSLENRAALDKPIAHVFSITYNCRIPRERRILDGRYGLVDKDITEESFPVAKGRGIIGPETGETGYLHLGCKATIRNVIEEAQGIKIKREGWGLSLIDPMVSHGATFPQEQCEAPIVGAGSLAKIEGRYYALYLDQYEIYRGLSDNNRRVFCLAPAETVFEERVRFLLYRKLV